MKDTTAETSNPERIERARSTEAKGMRERAILDSATRLASEHGIRSVTLTDIAAGVGMHKSTMLRYFETREEIFLRLSAEHWTEWSATVGRDVEAVGRERGHGHPLGAHIDRIADALAETLTARPLFCDLLAHTPLNLERGVSHDSVVAFKLTVLGCSGAVRDALVDALGITARQAGDVVATATSMAGALWQMAAVGTPLRALYESDPRLSHAVVDVRGRLTDILAALLRGYLRA